MKETKKVSERNQQLSEDFLREELQSIKRLLVLIALKSGATQTEVAKVLQIDNSFVSHMVAGRK